MTTIQHSATVKGDDQLTVGALRAALAGFPDDAKVDAVIKDIGSQRDPLRVFVGVHLSWTTETTHENSDDAPRPHSRACGLYPHPHGAQCASDCPTCGGRA